MTLQTQQQPADVEQSDYATKSVEEQGQALNDAAKDGTLKRFTDADWAVFIDSGALGWKDSFLQRLFLHRAAYNGYLNQIPHPVWTVLMDQDLLKEKDSDQMLFLHCAAWNGYLDQIPHCVWTAVIDQDLLKERDYLQRLFLHRAALKGCLNQTPHYVFAHMTPERGYGVELWLGKDSDGDNILDNAALLDDGERFPKAMIPALWRGRVAVLTTLWAEMKDDLKGRDGVQEAYQRFLLHPMLRPQGKRLYLSPILKK